MGNIVVTQPSVSVGDYLKAVWEIAGSGAASTKGVADRLSVSSASVTNMFARLQMMGLALYEPYRGASLTRRGRTEALRLVRRHRLIETFLLEHLGYSWEDVHEEAERLEHAVSDEFLRSAWPRSWAIRSEIPMARPSPHPTARCRPRIRDPSVGQRPADVSSSRG